MDYLIAFDTETRRPGCAIIQAAMGGTVPSSRFEILFPSETWILSPTPSMQLFGATEEQLQKLSLMAKTAT